MPLWISLGKSNFEPTHAQPPDDRYYLATRLFTPEASLNSNSIKVSGSVLGFEWTRNGDVNEVYFILFFDHDGREEDRRASGIAADGILGKFPTD